MFESRSFTAGTLQFQSMTGHWIEPIYLKVIHAKKGKFCHFGSKLSFVSCKTASFQACIPKFHTIVNAITNAKSKVILIDFESFYV